RMGILSAVGNHVLFDYSNNRWRDAFSIQSVLAHWSPSHVIVAPYYAAGDKSCDGRCSFLCYRRLPTIIYLYSELGWVRLYDASFGSPRKSVCCRILYCRTV